MQLFDMFSKNVLRVNSEDSLKYVTLLPPSDTFRDVYFFFSYTPIHLYVIQDINTQYLYATENNQLITFSYIWKFCIA